MSDPHEAGAPRRCTGLERILDLDLAGLDAIWGRSPRHVPAAALPSPFADLLSTQDVDALLSQRGLRAPFLRVAKEGRTLPDADFTRGGGVGAAIADQLDDTALLRLFASGHTLVLQGLHRSHPPLLHFSQQLAADLGHPVQVNAYVTPAQSTGFSAHYDVHDVFVLQTAGEKRWRLHRPVHPHPLRDQPWQQREDAVSAAAAADPHLEVTLQPGDVLYIPRGWLHAATALGSMSTHVTVGVHVWHRGHLAETLLDEARTAVAAHSAQRTSLRPGVDVGDADDIRHDLEQVRAALLEALAAVDGERAATALEARHRSGQRPEPVPPVATVEAASDPGPHDVRPRAHLRARVRRIDGECVLVSRAGRVVLTEDEARLVERWLGDEPGADLGPQLARRLLLAGVGRLRGQDPDAVGSAT
ncbi:JmjC domain-containing protein [Janibacter sp. GS2]|uniref:cupin domain-containing protein n=1 Tax=Janibacter sp. GS2 TaxID=3442646 RepID=UPI003EBF2A9B